MSPSLTSSVALELQALHNTGQTFPVVVKLMNATRWGHAAALALISYDTLLTVRDEIQYIWPMKLSVIKVFIYGNRLLALFMILVHAGPMVGLDHSFTTKYCQGTFVACGYCSTVAFSMTNWIMLGRTKALLGGNRMYNILLTSFYFLVLVASFVLVTISLISLASNTFYSNWLHMCGIVSRSNIMGERNLLSCLLAWVVA
ncbi:hypothetical protein FRC16_007039 [Serendipita sp. 398]|nr:hypothetical protein FRC16_007039 [Serendipita sp. 398]